MANFVSNDNATSLMNAINQKKDSKPGTITWAEWIALTDEQREGTHYIITNVPAKFSDKDAVFSIKDETLEFTNKTATVTDSRITADTYIFTFYHNQAVAQAAGIECSWTTGTVTFTVDENPSEDIVVDILCILPALATPKEDITAEDISYDNSQSGLSATKAQGAIDELSVRVINKNISQSYTGSPTDIVGVITEILTLESPHTWDVGTYAGKIQSTHSGGGDLGSWVGSYQLTVGYSGNYGTKGIIIAQAYAFEFGYDAGTYIVNRLANTHDLSLKANDSSMPYNLLERNTLNNVQSITMGGCKQSSFGQLFVVTCAMWGDNTIAAFIGTYRYAGNGSSNNNALIISAPSGYTASASMSTAGIITVNFDRPWSYISYYILGNNNE